MTMHGSTPQGTSTSKFEHRVPALPHADGLSVDVEDYFHVEAFANVVPSSSWPQFPSRVRENTIRVLDLFDECGCRATFFVLGWVAERQPALIREIAHRGHELGCHSYAHRRVFTLTPAQFREDLRRARGFIEDAAGVRVQGYRAPTFSIRRDSLWALEVLCDEGFLYDSSFFPVRHDLYGFPEAPRFIHWRSLGPNRGIIEVPMSTVRLGGTNVPVGGGGYLRLLPMCYTRWALRRLRHKELQPAIVYLHPWEVDPHQPRLNGGWKSRLRHYTGLGRMEKRLRELLRNGRYQPLIELVRQTLPSAGFPAASLASACR